MKHLEGYVCTQYTWNPSLRYQMEIVFSFSLYKEHIHNISKQSHNMLKILKILCKLGPAWKFSQILAERNWDTGRAKCSGRSMRKMISDCVNTFKNLSTGRSLHPTHSIPSCLIWRATNLFVIHTCLLIMVRRWSTQWRLGKSVYKSLWKIFE